MADNSKSSSTPAPHPIPRLILASASPRRLELLRQIGIAPDDVVPTEVDEQRIKGESPEQMARRLARAKAEAGRVAEPNTFVLAADTLVVVGRRVLGKPSGEAEAAAMLRFLSGRRHRVITGIALITPNKDKSAGHLITRSVTTRVQFKRLTWPEIVAYIGCGEWQGKAGAYAIQGRAGALIKRIDGSYSNVVGLPLFEVANLLQGNGYSVLASESS